MVPPDEATITGGRTWNIDTPVWMVHSKDMEKRKCCRCHKVLPISGFYLMARRGGEYSYSCKDCDKRRTRKMRADMRLDLLGHYSKGVMACAICGESRVAVLDLDHIEGGGIKERALHKTPFAYYIGLKRSGYPTGLRVLCRNCNWMAWIERKDKKK